MDMSAGVSEVRIAESAVLRADKIWLGNVAGGDAVVVDISVHSFSSTPLQPD